MENYFSAAFTLLFFTFAAASTLFTLVLLALRRFHPFTACDCHVCATYVSATWRSNFPNLSDWFAHLLSNSATATIRIHVTRNVITASPANVHHILKSNFPNYPKGKQFSALLGDLLGRGIFNADGRRWLFQRKMASLELGSVSVRVFASDVFSSEIESRLLPLLSSAAAAGRVLDMQDIFRRFSFDTISRFSFGYDPGCLEISLPESEFAAAFDAASRLSAERGLSASPAVWRIKRFFGVGSERRLRDAIRTVDRLAEEVIDQRRRTGVAGKSDLLSRFMVAGGGVEDAPAGDDDGYLRDIVKSFLLAGRDTVAAGLTSFFWLMSRNPAVEAAIRSEAEAVMTGEKNDDVYLTPSFAVMTEMHYLTAAVYESLRLFPPVQFDSKFALNDDVLPDGTVVRKGDRVTYHPYAMGRMESIWGPDCLDFRPERWLDGEGRFMPRSPYEFTVFQGGARVCLGKEMAIVEMKTVILAVIRRFNVRLADPGRDEPRFSPGLTATVSGGLPMVVEELDHKRYDR